MQMSITQKPLMPSFNTTFSTIKQPLWIPNKHPQIEMLFVAEKPVLDDGLKDFWYTNTNHTQIWKWINNLN